MKQTWASRLLVGLLGLGLLLFFVAVIAISGRVALAQDNGSTSTLGAFLASATGEQAAGDSVSEASTSAATGLADDVAFRLHLVHSVRFPLTDQRCYFQFFVDAAGSSPLESASLALELVEDGRVVGLNQVEIADLSGQGLSRRIREFAFDGPCSLDGLRLISATGAFQPAGVKYTAPVDLLEADSVTTASFRPLGILIGADAPLSGLNGPTGGTRLTASASASESAVATESGTSIVASATGTAGADRTSVAAATSDLAGASPEASSGASLGASATPDSAMIVQRQPSLSQLERACVTTRSNLRAGPGTDYGFHHAQQGLENRYTQLAYICAAIGVTPNAIEYDRGYQDGPTLPRLIF